MLTIAAFTLREAFRRRIVVVLGTLSLLAIVLVAWGLARLQASIGENTAAIAALAILTILLAFAFSVSLAIGAAFLAAPAIAGDIESGIALAVLPRPLSRTAYILGKWLGLATLVVAYCAVFGMLAFVAIAIATGYRAPHPAIALLYLAAQSLVMLSIGLFFSTRLTPLVAGTLAIALFGGSWIAGIVAVLARSLGAQTVDNVAACVGLLVPSDGLWRGAVFSLTPVVMLAAQGAMPRGGVNPFGVTGPPAQPFLWWVAVWIFAVVAATVWSMRTRDV